MVIGRISLRLLISLLGMSFTHPCFQSCEISPSLRHLLNSPNRIPWLVSVRCLIISSEIKSGPDVLDFIRLRASFNSLMWIELFQFGPSLIVDSLGVNVG